MAKARPRGRPFKKGGVRPAGSGRKKGTGNVLTKQLRQLIQTATGLAGGGGDAGALKYLVDAAQDDRKSFLALLGRTVEQKVELTTEELPMVRIVNLSGLDLSDEKVRRRLGPTILGRWPMPEGGKK